MELTKEQEKEFAIWLDLEDIRKFIQENKKDYEMWLEQENQNLFFGTYIMLTKINMSNIQKLEMVL